jgi:Lon-like protease
VAATGTIDTSGNVGDIGGIRQKTVAVLRTGATLFLVPKDLESIAADEAKGSSLQVVGVSTLDEALAVLAQHGGNAQELGKPGAAASTTAPAG